MFDLLAAKAVGYAVPTVMHAVKQNFAEFRANYTATKTFFLFKDKSHSNETTFSLQRQIVQQQSNFFSPKTNHTATNTFFLFKDKSCSNVALFPFQKQIMQQRKLGEMRFVNSATCRIVLCTKYE